MLKNHAEDLTPKPLAPEDGRSHDLNAPIAIEDAPFLRKERGKGMSYADIGREEGILYRESEGEHLRFELRKKIGGLTYCFKIVKKHDDEFDISIETEEYDFALTQLSKDKQAEYLEIIRTIIDRINAESPVIRTLVISTAGEAYTVGEVEACKKEIMAQNKKLTQQELDNMYGFEILRMYEKLTGKIFPLERSQDPEKGTTPMDARRRFFRIYLKKYFPDWEVHEGYADRDFSLVKKDGSASVIA